MTAVEAHTLATAAARLKRMEQRIRDTCERGEFELVVDPQEVDHSMRALLQKRGFKVSTIQVRPSPGFGVSDEDQDMVDRLAIVWSH